MSSSIGNSSPNSQPASNLPSSVSSGGGGPKEKKKIIVQVDGSIVRKYAKDWSTDTGGYIKSYIPISYTDFSQVPKNFKDDVWNALMGDYELDVPPEVARPLLESSWSQKFRTYKHTLREHYLRKNITELPKGVDHDIWRKFVENENGQKKKECARNAKNHSKLEFSHCLGRCTYAQKKYMMQEENSKISLSRVDTWLEAHKQKGGKVLESAKEKYENVLAAKERNKDKRTFEDFDNDELVEVFGKDKKGRVRAMGSNISRKKLTHLGVAKSKLEQHKKSSQELASFKDEMISLVDSRMDNFEGLMQAILSKITTKSPTVVNSPVSDPGSSSVPRSFHLSQNIDNVFTTAGVSHSPCSPPPTTRNPQVILCDKFGKKLAKGYVVTDATSNMCHFKKVGYGEKKVYVEEVIDPDAPLFDPPQGGNHTFAGLVEEGFLIWLDCWLEYV